MRIEQKPLLSLLAAEKTQFVIPVYQRAYAWTPDQCLEFWLDIQRAARADRDHFTGTILFSVEDADAHGTRRRAVIDGQQRITTASILLIALCQHLAQTGTTAGGLDATTLARTYLLDESGMAPRLLLSRGDANTFAALVENVTANQTPSAQPPAGHIGENLAFFRERMADSTFDVQAFWRGLGHLTIIDAQVDNPDQAQMIFESLNSKGRPLTVADLVRNYLLLSEMHEEQARLYTEYWRPMEEFFAPDPGSLRLDSAIKGWLAVRFRKTRMRSPELVYSGFKQYVEDTYDGTKEDLLRELRGFCLVWAENYRFHAVKKFKSSYDWAINGAPTLVSHYPLKKAHNEAYAKKVREELKNVDARW